MAEVRKKEVKDKYNTSSIKIKETNKNSKKEIKKDTKKENSKEEKKGIFTRFLIFCNGVKGEFKKVHWTSKDDMVKYSVASIAFMIFFALFFYAIDVLFALIQSLLA